MQLKCHLDRGYYYPFDFISINWLPEETRFPGNYPLSSLLSPLSHLLVSSCLHLLLHLLLLRGALTRTTGRVKRSSSINVNSSHITLRLFHRRVCIFLQNKRSFSCVMWKWKTRRGHKTANNYSPSTSSLGNSPSSFPPRLISVVHKNALGTYNKSQLPERKYGNEAAKEQEEANNSWNWHVPKILWSR